MDLEKQLPELAEIRVMKLKPPDLGYRCRNKKE